MIKLFSFLWAIQKLGFYNCFLVLIYRLSVKTGYFYLTQPIKKCPKPENLKLNSKDSSIKFHESWHSESYSRCLKKAESLINGEVLLFSHEKYYFKSIPNWFINLKSKSIENKKNHWCNYKHFSQKDIKITWELSRFEWGPLLARAAILSRDKKYINLLNNWTNNWCDLNPINSGPNWICGQEASIRMIHILQTWKIIDNTNKFPSLTNGRINFIKVHLERIITTIYYAKAQQNNHWISESAALFIGGNWLAKSNNPYRDKGQRFAEIGLKNLEESLNTLVMEDGSFSQHSTNYHRFVLDTLCQLELWRRWLRLRSFSHNFKRKFKLLTNWLSKFIDIKTGFVPNLGHNDGAYCYKLHDLNYCDFRPTLRLSNVLSKSICKWNLHPGPWDEPLYWLRIKNIQEVKKVNKKSDLLKDGGYFIFQPNKVNWGFIRLPIYNFRPAHADPLHLDLWTFGVNLLRDGGTFSYNSKSKYMNYCKGIEGHNCVEFDRKNPMIDLGRFLWGNWLTLEGLKTFTDQNNNTVVIASYKYSNGLHKRYVQVSECGKNWKIVDSLFNFKDVAKIRWRLAPIKWEIKGYFLESIYANLEIKANQTIDEFYLSTGYESKLYRKIEKIPVLEILFKNAPVEVTLNIELKN